MNTEINQSEQTRELLIQHYKRYPNLQAEDIFKFIFQSSFGCEHMLSDERAALEYIVREFETVSDSLNDCNLVEPLDGAYSRVSLSCLHSGITCETLARLFCLSAKAEENGKLLLEKKIQVAKTLVEQGSLPLERESFYKKLEEWESAGHPALHHSDEFRAEYRPAYRVISNRYVSFLPLFEAIDKLPRKERIVIAVEGGSASGKTTLSKMLENVYGCTVFHMDDFFLRPEQRTADRLAEVGGNVDRERFFDEILKPLAENREITYSRFDCSTQSLCPPTMVTPGHLTVIEGAYSMHPLLAPHYDLSVFLDIDREQQRERILKRNSPQFAERFFNEWIPLEQKYFSQMNIKEKCTLTITMRDGYSKY